MKAHLAVALAVLLTLFLATSQSTLGSSAGAITINSDGSVYGTNSIQHSSNVYTLTNDLSVSLFVQRSNIVINGAGFSLEGDIDLRNGMDSNPSNPTISNVVIMNLIIEGSVVTNGGGNNIFYNNIIKGGIDLSGCRYNYISHCEVNGIKMDYGADYNIITENNLNSALVFLSTNETVDKNYWSNYAAMCPDAKEIGNTGVGDQPYVYWVDEGKTTRTYQDNHPLMHPINVLLSNGELVLKLPEAPIPTQPATASPWTTSAPSTSITPTATVPEFPLWIILLFMVLTGVCVVLLRKHKISNCL
jgi:hypothetical protein